ncbi:unnamed protein product [Discula destructiva]
MAAHSPTKQPPPPAESRAAEKEDQDPETPYYPGHPKSLAGIAARAFALGTALALGTISTLAILLLTSSPLWRLPFLLAVLSVFHFLEFWTQARYNTRAAGTVHFLLTANGLGYAGAHVAAALECLLASNTTTTLLLLLLLPSLGRYPLAAGLVTLVGVAAVVVGQTVRSVAMVQAGPSFNHHVQETKKASHVLVTTGLYGTLRHPSYFGFYWWVLGIQLAMGNVVCFLVYVVVLYRYYSNRIPHEERFLIEFFGDEYVDYRKKVGTKIPFVP